MAHSVDSRAFFLQHTVKVTVKVTVTPSRAHSSLSPHRHNFFCGMLLNSGPVATSSGCDISGFSETTRRYQYININPEANPEKIEEFLKRPHFSGYYISQVQGPDIFQMTYRFGATCT